MKKIFSILFVTLLLLVAAFPVFAETDIQVKTSRYIIDDMANILSDYDEQQISDSLTKCLETTAIDSTIFVVTTDDNPYQYPVAFADDYLDRYTNVAGYSDDKLIYLIDMDTRRDYIGYDGIYNALTDYFSCQNIQNNNTYDCLVNKDYLGAVLEVIDFVSSRNVLSEAGCFQTTVDDEQIDIFLLSDSELSAWIPSEADKYKATRSGAYVLLYNQHSDSYYKIDDNGTLLYSGDENSLFVNPDKYEDSSSNYYDPNYNPDNYDPDPNDLSWEEQRVMNFGICTSVGLVIGLIVVAIFRLSIKMSAESARRAANDNTFGERVNLNLTRSTDTLIDSHTSRRYVPPPSSNSGGGWSGGGGGHSFGGGSSHGSFHHSSGGHSFGGSMGRKF